MPTRPPADAARIQTRLERLIRAGIRLYAEHTFERVLQEVADSARQVIEARYAAIGVLNPEGTELKEFVTSGIDAELRARIGAPPTGKGILGQLIRVAHPLRLRDLTTHPARYGFPAHHPHMRSFLGVPIVGRQGPIGNLYLAEKQGADEFSEEDQSIAQLLAAQAATAIESARLHDGAGRLLSELRTLQTSRDRFYAMINHELRNALTAVYGWADLLIRRAGPKAPRAAVEVYESAERTLTLLNDLLDLSRLDVSKLQPMVRETEAQQLVRDALHAVQPAADARAVRFDLKGKGGEVGCRTDPQRTQQILVNLLSNAVRHSPEGETVSVNIQATEDRVRFWVIDRGEGMTPEQQATVFDAFAGAGTKDSRGTGLGLTVSRQLARLLGGDLLVESQKGGGARFMLEILRYLDRDVKSPS